MLQKNFRFKELGPLIKGGWGWGGLLSPLTKATASSLVCVSQSPSEASTAIMMMLVIKMKMVDKMMVVVKIIIVMMILINNGGKDKDGGKDDSDIGS